MMLSGIRQPPRFTTRKSCREVDERGNTKMTLAYLKQLCREQSLYQTPELNDKLYLQYQGTLVHKSNLSIPLTCCEGFTTITEDIKPYTGLKTLWFEGNGVDKVQNLGKFTKRGRDPN
jgi:hypothetical protein